MKERLEGTFWCTCERCEVMPTPRECVCCREQPESESKDRRNTSNEEESYLLKRKFVFIFTLLSKLKCGLNRAAVGLRS